MATEKNFVKGLIVKKNPKAPDYILCGLSFKTDEFSDYIEKNKVNGWMNVDIKLSKGGKYYAELNEWSKNIKNDPSREKIVEPIDTTKKTTTSDYDPISTQVGDEINPDDIPF